MIKTMPHKHYLAYLYASVTARFSPSFLSALQLIESEKPGNKAMLNLCIYCLFRHQQSNYTNTDKFYHYYISDHMQKKD